MPTGAEIEIFKAIAPYLGVGGILALVMFVIYRKDVKFYTDLWSKQGEELRQERLDMAKELREERTLLANDARKQTEAVLVVVRENTAAFAANTEVVRAMHARLDGMDPPVYARTRNEATDWPNRRKHP